MKRVILTTMILSILFVASNLFAAEKILDYGFEDWTGNMYTTPGYIFSSGYESYMVRHDNASDVVSSYNANEMGQTWIPHSGAYFLLQNDGSYALNPSVPGITAGTVNASNLVGYNGTYGGQNPLEFRSEITTGEIFIRLWARFNKGFSTIGGNCKWIFIGDKGGNLYDNIYMHFSTSTSPTMKFYCDTEGSWLGSSVPLTNPFDGNWHKFSFYIDYNNGIIRGWYDVDNETAGNVTKSWTAPDGHIGGTIGPNYMYIQGNFSAQQPKEETYHALDDIEVWDGMPTGINPPKNLRRVPTP